MKNETRLVAVAINLASFIVGMTGLEPATTRPPDVYANQLRYIPNPACTKWIHLFLADAKLHTYRESCKLFARFLSKNMFSDWLSGLEGTIWRAMNWIRRRRCRPYFRCCRHPSSRRHSVSFAPSASLRSAVFRCGSLRRWQSSAGSICMCRRI